MSLSLGLSLSLGHNALGAGAITTLSLAAAASASLKLASSDGAAMWVDWGDGTVVSCASGATVSRTYASAYTGSVSVTTAASLSTLTQIESTSAGWNFSLSALPATVGRVVFTGSNTVTGDLSSIPLATRVNIGGSNTVTGNLSSIPLATYVNIGGSNTVTGNLSSIPLATYVNIGGSNTVTGNLSSIPLATYVTIDGSNTVTFSGAWTQTTMRQVYVRGSALRSTTVTNDMLIALAAMVTTWINEKVVNIKGTRTAASDAAVTTLQGRGVTVTIG